MGHHGNLDPAAHELPVSRLEISEDIKMNNTQVGGTALKFAPSVEKIPAGSQEIKVASKPVVSYSGTQQNDLLAALPRPDLESLFEHLELVQMPFGKELFE